MTAKKTGIWLAIILLPIVALWSYALIVALQGYDRVCGLLNRGRDCTIWQFIDDQVLNAFVAPGLIAASATWLMIVACAAVVYVLFCKRRARSAA